MGQRLSVPIFIRVHAVHAVHPGSRKNPELSKYYLFTIGTFRRASYVNKNLLRVTKSLAELVNNCVDRATDTSDFRE